MEITPKQFSALLTELKKVREHLEQLLQKREQQIEAVNTAQKSYEENRNIQPIWIDPILAKYAQSETERKAEAKRQASIQNSLRWAAWCTFIATTAAFGAAAYYARIASRQLEAMHIGQDSLVSVQRAYVTSLGNTNQRYPHPSGHWLITEEMFNQGTTPAVNTVHRMQAGQLLSEPTAEQFIGEDKDIVDAVESAGTVGPKTAFALGPAIKPDIFFFEHPVFKPHVPLPTVREGLYFWGWAAYNDTFPHTKPHITEFCQELHGIESNEQRTAFNLIFINCKTHNCTDEYCPDYQALTDKIAGIKR